MADLDTLFDLRGSAFPIFDPPYPYLDQTRVHQQHCYEPETGLIYATQVIGNGVTLADESGPPPNGLRDSRGDIAITRLTRAGVRTGVMYCRAFDHGDSIGAEYDPDTGTTYLYLSYDAELQPIGTNAHGRKIVRLPFVDGAIVDVGDPGLEVFDAFPGSGWMKPFLDLENQRMGVQHSSGDGTYLAVFDLADFKARNFSNPLYHFLRPTYPLVQCSVLYGNYLYVFHGRAYNDTDNPPPPDGTGDAMFTVIDIRSGQAIDRVPNVYFTELPYREPESVSVWRLETGPQFTFGFAVDGPQRRFFLAGITDTVPPPVIPVVAEVVGGTEPGVRLTVTVEDTATVLSWQIERHVSGSTQTLFSGDGASLPGVSTWMDVAPPSCIPLTYTLTVQRLDGTLDTYASDTLTFVPEGGCNQGNRSVGAEDNTLGCAQTYTARLHWRGGALPYESAAMDKLTEVRWNRTINDVSEARVTVLKGDISVECCRALGEAEPWVHEMTLYRDGELVWQGPIIRTTAGRDTIVIEALDVFAWLDRIVNVYRVTYTSATADSAGRKRGPITQIAANHIRLNVNDSRMGEPDWAGFLDYMVVRDAGLPSIKVEKDGSSNQSIWTAYVGDILREWAKRGLTWTTVGRALLLRGKPTSATRAQAQLTMEDFIGDIEVIKDGTQLATYGYASTQEEQDISLGKTLGWGRLRTPYGRVESLVEIQEENATDADLLGAVRSELAGRYPAPVAISVPDGSALAPTAPVTLRQLVPGERFDLLAEAFCTPVLQGFVLTDVEGSWQNDQEKIGVTFTPLADIEEELTGS